MILWLYPSLGGMEYVSIYSPMKFYFLGNETFGFIHSYSNYHLHKREQKKNSFAIYFFSLTSRGVPILLTYMM